MGTLYYGERRYRLDDRVLAHLQVVISMKLRRGENFFVLWRNPPGDAAGRNALWIDNGVAIAMEFDGSRYPAINREWVETLATSAGTNFGLQVTEEGSLVPLNSPPDERDEPGR